MPFKLFIGYRTRAVDNIEAMMPQFQPSRVLVDEKKIKADIEEKKAAFLREAKDMPYTGTFEEIFLIDPRNRKRLQYVVGTEKETKPPPALRVRNYLLKAYPDAWAGEILDVKKPEVVFIGFNPRLFLKMLGLECSLPHINKPLPPRMWYGTSDHRDIEDALIPAEFKRLTLAAALNRRRPLDEKSGQAWDALLAGWSEPGIIPEKDAQLAFELAVQLGLIEV